MRSAVGSGHFLISALNEIIAVKCELRILQNREGKHLKWCKAEVVNDELIITDEDDEFFRYNPKNRENSQIQEMFFHEKQTIIENSLFGADINRNSVKICRLRLWIELLKHAYYKDNKELETLPNIDINIKCGNSLISRFALNDDLKQAMNRSRIDEYRLAVQTYRNAKNREVKQEMEKLIADIKKNFRAELGGNNPKVKKLKKLKGDFFDLATRQSLVEESAKDKKAKEQNLKKLEKEIAALRAEVEEFESGKIYANAVEWRFEFPEVLNDDGDFTGFDVVIGNPPYFNIQNNYCKSIYFNSVNTSTTNIASLFINLGNNLTKRLLSFVVPKSICTVESWKRSRYILLNLLDLNEVSDVGMAFEEVGLEQIFFISSKKQNKKNNIKILNGIEFFYEKEQEFFIKRDAILTSLENKHISIIDKMEKGTPLGLIAIMPRGIYLNKKSFHTEPDNNLVLFIGGTNIAQFHIKDGGKRKPNRFVSIKNIEIKTKSEIFDRKRIVYQNVCSSLPRIVATIVDKFPTDDTVNNLILNNEIDNSYEFILGLLNSSLFEFYLKKIIINDSILTVHLDKPYIGKFPIILDNINKKIQIEKLTDKILIAKKKDSNSDTTALEKEIDRLVYELYGLTEEEIEIVEKGI